MKRFSLNLISTLFLGLMSILLVSGCEEKGNLPVSAEAKKADSLDFLRGEDASQDPRGKAIYARAFAGDKTAAVASASIFIAAQPVANPKTEQAFAYLNTAADSGNWFAMERLSNLYGRPQFKNPEKQAQWGKRYRDTLMKAADQTNLEAMEQLASAYRFGWGNHFSKDEVQSCSWYKAAAALGSKVSEQSAAECFIKGTGGTPKNIEEGIRLLSLGAERGEARSIVALIKVYRHDLPEKKLEEDYFGHLLASKSSEDGSTLYFAAKEYCPNLGFAPLKACEGNPQLQQRPICQKCSKSDEKKSLQLHEKAANLGDDMAAGDLARYYAENLGSYVFDGPQLVRKWQERAAELGVGWAQYEVGRAYVHGIGATPKDPEKGAMWLLKAAIQNYADAQLLLGALYERGIGLPADAVLAYAWVNLAIPQFAAEYQIKVRREGEAIRSHLEKVMSREQISEAQRIARAWIPDSPLVRSGEGTPIAQNAGKPRLKGTGTMFLVSKNGYAITNQHVASGCAELRIQGREGLVKLVTEDAANDLALLQAQGPVNGTATIAADPGKLRQGEEIVAFGFPLNSVLSSGGNLTPGMVSAMTGVGNNTNQIQITAPIQPGSSGSPVLNKKGEVVGVVSMKLSDSKMAKATGSVGQNVNFAVSGQTLKAFLDAHKVEYRTGGFLSFGKSTADLADEARLWTLVVECWK